MEELKVSNKRTPAKVGQAVYDILSKPQYDQEVGETVNEMTASYFNYLNDCINESKLKYEYPFYVVILRKKEHWALNVLKQFFIGRQTKPSARVLRNDYKHFDHDVWKIDKDGSSREHLWTLPTEQDSQTILKNFTLYDPKLVENINAFNKGELI